jgi:hypothetical protein
METQRLVVEFAKAATYLLHQMEHHGWRWSSTYLREHVRVTGFKFPNSRSPEILRALVRANPHLRPYVVLGKRKIERKS